MHLGEVWRMTAGTFLHRSAASHHLCAAELRGWAAELLRPLWLLSYRLLRGGPPPTAFALAVIEHALPAQPARRGPAHDRRPDKGRWRGEGAARAARRIVELGEEAEA